MSPISKVGWIVRKKRLKMKDFHVCVPHYLILDLVEEVK